MANELNIVLTASGETVTCQPYAAGAASGSPITLTEIGTSGVYTGDMTGSAGTYLLVFNDGTENVGVGSIVWSGTAEVPVSTLTTGDLPSVPSAASVASAVRTELTELSNLDASVSSRLASADYTTPPTTAQISAAVEGSLLDENDGQAVLNAIVGAIGNTNLSEVSLVAAVRADLERSGGKLDSIPTDAAPSAASVASAVWSASTKEITGGTVDTLTNSPDVPTEAEIAAQVRTELSVELGRIDQAISTRLASADYTAPSTPPTAAAIADEVRVELASELANLDAPVSGATAPSAATVASQVRTELTAELAKVSALNTERLNNTATTAIVGHLLSQANS